MLIICHINYNVKALSDIWPLCQVSVFCHFSPFYIWTFAEIYFTPPQPPLPCKTVFPRVYWNHPSGWLFSWLVCLSPKMIWVLFVWSDLPQILRNHFKILYYKLWTDQKCARHIFSFQSCHGLQNYSPLNFAMFLLFNFTMNFGT